MNPASAPELFHISFRGDGDGIWLPRNPAGYEDSNKGSELSEPDLPRISFSPSIEKCFLAVYPNVSRMFEKENYPYLLYHVYQPVIHSGLKMLSPQELTKNRYVWDAHITQEHVVLNKVEVRRVGKVKIMNTHRSKLIETRPFGDSSMQYRTVGPAKIHYKWVETVSLEHLSRKW